MQRSLWKGAISFGLVHIPVELFSAEKSDDLDLTMLDRRDFAPIGYRRINKETGDEVSWDDIVKGYEYEKGQYVVLSDEDLKRANVKASQTIDIMTFVDAEDVSLLYYERPYYLAPGKGGDKVYALLRETLRRAGKVGIAQIVIHTKQHLAALIVLEDVIVLNTLRYAQEIRPAEDLDLPDANLKRAGISDKEVQMALSLVEGMTEAWKPTQYRDTYRDDVMAVVEKKIKANQTKTITQPEPEEKQPSGAKVIDLMAILKQSIAEKTGKQTSASTRRTAAPKEKAKPAPVRKASTSKTRSAAAAADTRRSDTRKPAAPRRSRA